MLYIVVRTDEQGTSEYNADSWVPDQFWDPSNKFEQSMMGDAQQQLEGSN